MLTLLWLKMEVKLEQKESNRQQKQETKEEELNNSKSKMKRNEHWYSKDYIQSAYIIESILSNCKGFPSPFPQGKIWVKEDLCELDAW